MKTVLVTGGAGYIGSALVKELLDKGHKVIVVDNLSSGQKDKVDKEAKFYELDITNQHELEKVFSENMIDAVMHLAAYKEVDESGASQKKYDDNVKGTQILLNAMKKYEVQDLIFSSSAAVYGDAKEIPILEDDLPSPTNQYGISKQKCEETIFSQGEINYIILRYFNVAGDSGLKFIEKNCQNVFGKLVNVLNKKEQEFVISGADYSTPDGTPIRDFVHVSDIVAAHIKAMNAMYELDGEIINLGCSEGASIKELHELFEKVAKQPIPIKEGPRREGDIVVSIASNTKARILLGWEPKHGLKEMVESSINVYN